MRSGWNGMSESSGKAREQRALFEAMEQRCLLSAGPVDPGTAGIGVLDAGGAAVHAAAAATCVPNVVGKYVGTAKMKELPLTMGLTITITQQTGNKIKGTAATTGYPAARFTGTIVGSRVTGKWSQGGSVGSFSGKLSGTKKLTGTLCVTVGGQKYTGQFTISKA